MAFTYDDLPDLMTVMTGDEKHGPSATSTLDVLWVLYHRVLRIDHPADPNRDRFYLSKGHGPMAYYAVLAAHGFLSHEQLETFGQYDSILGFHPDGTLIPGVEIGSGSLGHGLRLATGTATALRIQQKTARVVVLLGDAELDEGSNHEAIVFAGRRGLENLTATVIDNDSSSLTWQTSKRTASGLPSNIAERFAIEGWSTATVDGRDHEALTDAFEQPHPGRPHVVVARVEKKEQ